MALVTLTTPEDASQVLLSIRYEDEHLRRDISEESLPHLDQGSSPPPPLQAASLPPPQPIAAAPLTAEQGLQAQSEEPAHRPDFEITFSDPALGPSLRAPQEAASSLQPATPPLPSPSGASPASRPASVEEGEEPRPAGRRALSPHEQEIAESIRAAIQSRIRCMVPLAAAAAAPSAARRMQHGACSSSACSS
jgi:hypothetical protein